MSPVMCSTVTPGRGRAADSKNFTDSAILLGPWLKMSMPRWYDSSGVRSPLDQ